MKSEVLFGTLLVTAGLAGFAVGLDVGRQGSAPPLTEPLTDCEVGGGSLDLLYLAECQEEQEAKDQEILRLVEENRHLEELRLPETAAAFVRTASTATVAAEADGPYPDPRTCAFGDVLTIRHHGRTLEVAVQRARRSALFDTPYKVLERESGLGGDREATDACNRGPRQYSDGEHAFICALRRRL